ncbi:phage tail protein [Candidatus Enterococcus ikei]|uniref:Uncharacterized protein n=1 Tax=Candidatus Enterococcus ikei TaxID=2815326 RepID=A0ABS3GWF0_9ENTE|nr:hypothetical protein [Enterococcus sp. DIV0869a]MBO0439193.1 hypothetical protein [Enterococcus sp. DIV0869a]
MTKEILPTTNKKFIQAMNKSMKVTKSLDKQISKTTKRLNNFIKPLSKSSKLSKPFADIKKQVTALNQAITANDLASFQTALAAVGTTFSELSVQSMQMIRSLNQASKSYEFLSQAFQGNLTIDDTSLVSLDSQTKNLIQSFSNVQTTLASLKSELTIDSTSITTLIDSGKKLTAEFSLINQNMATFTGAFTSSQSVVTSFGGAMNSTLVSIDSSINNLVSIGENLGNVLANAIKEPATEVEKSKSVFESLKDRVTEMFTSFDIESIKNVYKGFGMINAQISKGTGFFSNFTQSVTGSTKGIVENISNFGASMLSVGKHSTTSAKVVSGTLGGIGNVIKGSANVGITALSSMVQGLTSVMGLALKAIAPTAFLGVLLAGFALMDQQMNGQISSMIQTAITKGPEIIKGFVQGIIDKLPDLITSGTQLVAGLAEAISVNLPVIIQSGIALLQTLIDGVIANLPSLIDSALLIIETLANSILTAAPQLLLMGLELLSALVDGLFQDPTKLIDTMTSIIDTLTNEITTSLPKIIDKGIEILVKLAEGIASVLPALIPVALQAITTLVRTLSENLPKLLDAAVEIVGKLCEGLLANLPQILAAAIQLILAIVQGIGESIPKIVIAGGKIMVKLIETVGKAIPDIKEAGKNLIRGLIDGIKGKISDLMESIKSIAGAIKDKFAGLFKIKSPSRWMRDKIGAMLPAGLAIGIERNTHIIDKPMDDLTSKVFLPSLDSIDQQVDSVQKLSTQSSSSSTQTLQVEKQPATFNIKLGNQQFKAFVSDISEAMGQDSAINLAF